MAKDDGTRCRADDDVFAAAPAVNTLAVRAGNLSGRNPIPAPYPKNASGSPAAQGLGKVFPIDNTRLKEQFGVPPA